MNFKQLASTQMACEDVDTWLSLAASATVTFDTMTVLDDDGNDHRDPRAHRRDSRRVVTRCCPPISHWGAWAFFGSLTFIDLIAATTNALNGALLARRPDHFRNFTIVGILLMALFGGLGGGVTRDVILGRTRRRRSRTRRTSRSA